METSCKQRCNVVEQTPSRLRVAAHFVCSIYQSKPDNKIYEWNKGSHYLWVNTGSQRKRNLTFISLFLRDKAQSTKSAAEIWKCFSVQKAFGNIRAGFKEVLRCSKSWDWTVTDTLRQTELFNSVPFCMIDEQRKINFPFTELSQWLLLVTTCGMFATKSVIICGIYIL